MVAVRAGYTDLVDDWSSDLSGQGFTFNNSDSTSYWVDITGRTYANSYADGSDNGVLMYSGAPTTIGFDDHISGFAVGFSSVGAHGGTITFEIDGEPANLYQMYLAGEVEFDNLTAANFSTDGSILTSTPDSASTNDMSHIYFNVPIKSFSATAAASNDSVMDFYIDQQNGSVAAIPCFTAGTLIDTDRGPVPVETLHAGDMIRTKDHGFQPVKWVGGSRVYDAPVRIKAGTFGNARDLVVSPRHRMLLQGWQMGLLFNHDEAFAAAKDMQNGTTITMEPEGWVTYYHILLDRHEVIYAEEAETESFFPDEASLNGMAKNTREELAQTVDLSTFGRTARPTLTPNQAMYLSHNMDLLEDAPNQIAAQ